MAWSRAGTVNLANGSAAVVGATTGWVAGGVSLGDVFTADNVTLYEIIGIADDTHLTLDRPYAGTTASGAGYAIIRNLSPPGAAMMTTLTTLTGAVNTLIGDYESPPPVAAANVLYTPGLSGGLARTVAAKISDIVSALDFSVDPTGAADSYAAFFEALADVGALSVNDQFGLSGTTTGYQAIPSVPAIRIPSGWFTLSATIPIPPQHGLAILSDGAIFKPPSGQYAFTATYAPQRLHMRGVTAYGGAGLYTSTEANETYIAKLRFERCGARLATSYAINQQGLASSGSLLISQCEFQDCLIAQTQCDQALIEASDLICGGVSAVALGKAPIYNTGRLIVDRNTGVPSTDMVSTYAWVEQHGSAAFTIFRAGRYGGENGGGACLIDNYSPANIESPPSYQRTGFKILGTDWSNTSQAPIARFKSLAGVAAVPNVAEIRGVTPWFYDIAVEVDGNPTTLAFLGKDFIDLRFKDNSQPVIFTGVYGAGAWNLLGNFIEDDYMADRPVTMNEATERDTVNYFPTAEPYGTAPWTLSSGSGVSIADTTDDTKAPGALCYATAGGANATYNSPALNTAVVVSGLYTLSFEVWGNAAQPSFQPNVLVYLNVSGGTVPMLLHSVQALQDRRQIDVPFWLDVTQSLSIGVDVVFGNTGDTIGIGKFALRKGARSLPFNAGGSGKCFLAETTLTNAITTISGSPVLTVSVPGHGRQAGGLCYLSGFSFNGVNYSQGDLFTIDSIVDANNFTVSGPRIATASGAGAGTVEYQPVIRQTGTKEFEGPGLPSAGTWYLGDRLWLEAPAAAAVPGYVCTATGGSGGTWKAMGALAA
jgi:hypothetical protein